MKNHNSAGYYSLTGHAPPIDDQRLRDSLTCSRPTAASSTSSARSTTGDPDVRRRSRTSSRDGTVTPGQHASFLGKAHDPLFVGQDPNGPTSACPS